MTNANEIINSSTNAVLEGQQSFQSAGKPAAKKAEKKASQGSAKKNADIPKVKAEIVSEDELKAQEERDLELSALALKSLDQFTNNIRREIDSVSKSFCRIGFYLWKIRENRLFEKRGFKNVYEFGEAALNFKKSSTSNYINVCERFSRRDAKGNPTRELMDDFKAFSYTQLTEVLALPEEVAKEVTPEMTIKEIRKKKAAAKKAEVDAIEPGSVADGSFKTDKDCCPPICIWERVVDHKNLDVFLKAIKENIGREFVVYIEQEAPVAEVTVK